jgi:GT2 family glycosyltransferase
MPKDLKLSIIYVNWNCDDEIVASIASVRRWSIGVPFEILVVDNASPNGLGELERAEDIVLIRSSVNGGFGAGCNLGAKHAQGRYLLFLNPDTRFLNDVANLLIEFLESHPLVAAVGPRVEDSEGRVLYEGGRSLPTLSTEFLVHSTLAFRFPQGKVTSRPLLSRWDHQSTREVEAILGACMLIPAEVFKTVGGFDESFFLYCEELDLCLRMRDSGLQIWYLHTARILHKERQSTIKHFGSTNRIVLENMRSQYHYFRKHEGKLKSLIWRKMVAALYFLRYIRSREQHHLEYLKWAIAKW